MARSTNRNFPKSEDLMVVKEELEGGRRIVVAASAGPRLSGKKGIVLGPGATASRSRCSSTGQGATSRCTPATLICLTRLLADGAEMPSWEKYGCTDPPLTELTLASTFRRRS